MVVKDGDDVSRHAESPTPMPVMMRSSGFFPQQHSFFARNRALAETLLIIVSASSHEVGEALSVDFSSTITPSQEFLQRIGRVDRTSSQLPRTVSLAEYIRKAMRHAAYEVLSDGTFYAEIPGFQGVWANASTLEACVEELRSALEDWVLLCVSDGLSVPEVGGVRFVGKEHV